MRSTGPWHVVQPTPLFTWMLWLKYTKSGRSWTRVHSMDRPVLKLARTGSRNGLVEKICEWQCMQVLVGGIPAKEESLDGRVAIPAVEAVAGDVALVAELDGLFARDVDVSDPRTSG